MPVQMAHFFSHEKESLRKEKNPHQSTYFLTKDSPACLTFTKSSRKSCSSSGNCFIRRKCCSLSQTIIVNQFSPRAAVKAAPAPATVSSTVSAAPYRKQ